MPAALCGVALLAATFPLGADETPPPSREREAEAAGLRAEIPNLPKLVRRTPNIYLVRIESVETPEPARGGTPEESEPDKVTATVQKTLKGKRAKKLTLNVRQRPVDAAEAGLLGGGLSVDADALQQAPVFFAPRRFLSARNPILGGPRFKKDKLYLVFTDMGGKKLLGGPYGYQPVLSEEAFWVRTVKRLISEPDSKHAIKMSFRDFVIRHRSAFVMVIGDCLGTEVSLSEPLWGEPVSREDIDPARVLPESAEECAGAMDEKRGYLGLIEAEPWLYQAQLGYPNQVYVEIRDGMLDFSELGFDIGFPDGGRISVAELAARMQGGSAH